MERRTIIAALFAAAAVKPAFRAVATAQTADDLAARLLGATSPLGDRALGDPNAPVVMIEYASATCPHCAEFHDHVLPQIKADYIDTGMVRFIFREFPLDQLALGAFMLARCLPVDRYFNVLDRLFRDQRTWAKAQNPAFELFKITEQFGMNRSEFEACSKREDLARAIIESTRAAAKAFSIKGTPAIFINGEFIDAHEDMPAVRAALDKALAQ